MTTLHIINNLQRGGAESMLYKITKYSVKKNVLIFNLIGENLYNFDTNKVKIINFNFKSLNLLIQIVNLYKLILFLYKYKPSTIYFWLYHACLLSIFIKLTYLKKSIFIWNIRQVIPNFKYEKKTTKFVFSICKIFSFLPNAIIFNSIESKNNHINAGFKSKKNIYIPNGFEEPVKENNHIPGFHEKIKNKYVVALIARYHQSKGHDIFLKSIKYIYSDKIIFILAGNKINKDNKDLKNIIDNENVSNKVLLLDQILKVDNYLDKIDLLVNCSTSSEGFPNIIGEAIMNNCLCIASDISDNKKILIEDQLIIKDLNSKNLANKIMEIHNLELDKKNHLKIKLKKHFLNKYDIYKIVNMYDNLKI